jgi:hypothetical protein
MYFYFILFFTLQGQNFKKIKWELLVYAGRKRTTCYFYFSEIFLKITLFLYGEYANRRKKYQY